MTDTTAEHGTRAAPRRPADPQGRAAKLLETSLVWDNHGCMPLRPDEDTFFLDQLERYRHSGVDVVALNVAFDAVPWHTAPTMLAHFRHYVQTHADRYLLVGTVEDVERARREGRLGVFFDIEGGSALDGRLAMVSLYYDLGVRWMLIAYNRNNALGGGCQDDDEGLTDFGRRVIDEMARVGMIVCCSHTGFRTTMEVMERAQNPVIFSHSNPLGAWNHSRNVTDDAIKACAETGGVVGINGVGCFLGENDTRSETVVRHIDYVAELVGPEHVGLGLDYCFDRREMDDFLKNNPDIFPPEQGYASGIRIAAPEQIPEIAEGLLDTGYSEDEVRGMLGENHLRVARQVWK